MRKIIILVTVLIIGIAGMAYLYFSKLSIENSNSDMAIKIASSNNASLVFTYHNDKSFYQIIEGQDLLQKIIGKDKNDILNVFKHHIIENEVLFKTIKDQPIYLSLVPDEDKELNILITAETTIDKSINYFENALKQNNINIEKTDSIYKAKFSDSTSIYFYVKDRIFTASNSPNLIKKSISKVNGNNFSKFIIGNNQFKKNILATLYVNFNVLPVSLNHILRSKIDGDLSILNKQNSYAALQYNFSKEKILFNGNSQIDEDNNYLKTFENIPSQEISIINLLPKNTANYSVYAFNDYKNWHQSLLKWFKNQHLSVDKTIKEVKDKYRIDLNSVFPVYSKNQFITFQLNTGEKLAAVYLSNGEKVKQLLLDVSENYSDEIKIFKTSGILFSYYGEPFKNFNRPYYTIKDNNLIVANNASTIQVFLNQYKSNNLLIKTPEYADALNELSNTSNITFYINFKNSISLFKNGITSDYFKYFNSDDGLKYFDSFHYQLSADKNKFTTTLLFNKYLEISIPDTTSLR